MRPLLICAIALATSFALAADCGTSKQFVVDGSQRLEGMLRDPTDSPIPGLGLELLEGNRVVQTFRTDSDGKFALGQIPSGKYRIRVTSHPFCAPKIDCRDDICGASGKLRLNEKKAKPVLVF